MKTERLHTVTWEEMRSLMELTYQHSKSTCIKELLLLFAGLLYTSQCTSGSHLDTGFLGFPLPLSKC
jgi:hypothetical protein